MSHLLQLPADAIELPAVQKDEVLFVFKCESDNICSFWESDAGTNAVFTVKRSELGSLATDTPADADGDKPIVLEELGIAGWRVDDDGAPAELEASFYDCTAYDALPEAIANPHDWDREWRTKVGGAPAWTGNGVLQLPAGRLLLQLDSWLTLEDGSTVEPANFCSDGTAYVFVDRSQEPPAYSMIINR